jgi:NAD(P)-dependent dehydrogenase (short-subunit alcohol dehydrogenase family)
MIYIIILSFMSSTGNKQIAVVTGSSSGIGLETSFALARGGFLTYATMRNLEKQNVVHTTSDQKDLTIRTKQLDVTDENSVNKAVQSIISEAGRIDVLVNNAGFAVTGAFEDVTLDEVKTQYDTNVYGIIRTTQAVLPTMRKQGSGRIINISSGAGLFGYPGGSAYVSSKFAIEGLTESMSYELEQFGIKAILVEPGVIRTNFGGGMVLAKKAQDPKSPYSQLMQMMSSVVGKLYEQAPGADLVARVVVEAATTANPKLRYLVGKDVEQMAAAKKSMSDEQFQSLMKQGVT